MPGEPVPGAPEARRLAAMVSGLNAIVWEGDPQTLEVRWVNDRITEVLGHPVAAWRADPDLWRRVIHPEDRDDAVAEIRRVTGGAGVDVLYDVTGAAAVFGAALGAVARFGRLILLGDTGTPSAQRLTKDVIVNGLSVIGAHDMHGEHPASEQAPWNNVRMGDLFFRYLARGDMRVDDLVSHRFQPERAADAYQLVQSRDPAAMGILFNWR